MHACMLSATAKDILVLSSSDSCFVLLTGRGVTAGWADAVQICDVWSLWPD